MSVIAEQPTPRPKSFQDPSKAKSAATLSHEARRRNTAIEQLEQLKQRFPDLFSNPPAIAQIAPSLADGQDDYMIGRLTRVRSQLDAIDNLITSETDPARLDRLAAASAKLSEVERQLAGRPLPGSLRPTGKQSAASMIEVPTVPAHSQAPAVKTEEQE